MNKFLLILLPTVILLSSISSNAAKADEWTLVSSSTSGIDYYVNTQSMKKKHGSESYLIEGGGFKTSSQYMEAWWKTISADGSYVKTKTNFFCNNDVSKDISNAAYSANGTYISSPHVSSFAISTIPDTSFSTVFSFVCR